VQRARFLFDRRFDVRGFLVKAWLLAGAERRCAGLLQPWLRLRLRFDFAGTVDALLQSPLLACASGSF
jgi:hypothetical protein